MNLTIGDKGPKNTVRSPRIDVQLKCTQGEPALTDQLPYALKVKNYRELRYLDYMVPRILIVLWVPDDTSAWLTHSEQELVLRRCAWWVSLRGHPATSNTTSVTVRLPRENLFHVDALRSMLDRVGAGGMP